MPARIHEDELDVPPALVRRLLAAQHPQWADLPLTVAGEWGTDHAMYRLGDDLVVRLPRIGWAVKAVAAEQRWLPFLGPQLPVEIPEVVATGEPGEGYPWPWTVLAWIEGEHPPTVDWWGAEQLAVHLARFNRAVAALDPTDGPIAGSPGGPQRGIPIRLRDEQVRGCIAQVADEFDADGLLAAWEADAFVADHEGDPVWVHGDLTPGNLLLREGRLTGVLDFGGVSVGDPAVGLLPAWNLFAGQARRTFRDSSDADEAAWRRGRAWALSIAVVALPYYRDTFPAISASSRRVLTEVLGDHEREALGPAMQAVLPDGYQQGAYLADAKVEAENLGGPVPPPPRQAPRGPASFGDAARPAADVDIWCNHVAGPQVLVDEVAAAVTTETHLVARTDDLERVD